MLLILSDPGQFGLEPPGAGEVIFTWNEGESWYDFKVTNTPFEVP